MLKVNFDLTEENQPQNGWEMRFFNPGSKLRNELEVDFCILLKTQLTSNL